MGRIRPKAEGEEYYALIWEMADGYRPPHLKAAFAVSAAADFQQCWVYHTGGTFEFGWQIPYAIFMARDSLERQGLNAQLLSTLVQPVRYDLGRP